MRGQCKFLLFSAEVPNGPFRTCPVTTEAVAAPLHPLPVAPANPTVVAPNARVSPVRSVRQKRRLRPGQNRTSGFDASGPEADGLESIPSGRR